MNFDFSGKKILITGGIRGIGLSVAKMFSASACKMVLGYKKNHEIAESVYSELSMKKTDLKIISGDLSSENECERFIKNSQDFLGDIDIFVHCCGIRMDAPGSMMKNSYWNKVINTNLNSAFYCSKLVSKNMLKKQFQDLERPKDCITISSNQTLTEICKLIINTLSLKK